MHKKILMFMIMGMFLLTFVSAGDLTFQKDTPFNLTVICLNDGYCSASANCNINVLDPNGNRIVEGQNMTNQISFHNYTLTPSTLGTYEVSGYCKDGTYSKPIDFPFEVTPTGESVGIEKAIIQIGLLFFIIFFLALSLVGILKFDHYIAKFTLYWVSHVLTIAITFISWQMASDFISGTPMIAGIFKIAFYFFTIGAFPMVLLSLAWIFYIHTMNDDIKKMMERGIDENEATQRAGGKRW